MISIWTWIPKVPSWFWQASQLFGHIVLTLDSYLQSTLKLLKILHILLSLHGLHLLHETGQSSWISFTALHVFSSGFNSLQKSLFEQFQDEATWLAVLSLPNGVPIWYSDPNLLSLSFVSNFPSLLLLSLVVSRIKWVGIVTMVL